MKVSSVCRKSKIEPNIIGDGPLLGILEERFGNNGRLNFIGPLIGENLLNHRQQ